MSEYETIDGPVETELEISRSRFLTRLERVDTEDGARAAIASVRAEHPRARHHCTAFILGHDGRTKRSSDDGEPSGTAGAPMLDALVAAGLSDVVAIVTRYFGGVLLGAGGLTRAYRSAVAEATSRATRVRRALRTVATVQTGYDLAPLIEAEARRRGIVIDGADYGADVTLRLLLSAEEHAPTAAFVAELTAGGADLVLGEQRWVDLP